VAYQVSASAFLGDIALTIFVYTGATMINSGNFDPIGWLGSQGFHWVIIGVALVCSLVYYKNTKPKYLGDVYHAVVILPLFMYFILVLVPVYYYYCSFSQGLVGLGLLLFWVLSVVYDMKEERLDQRKWIKKNRPNWTLRD
jgi:asparagine N-glycosylation enzyme membrane subunit Stt3